MPWNGSGTFVLDPAYSPEVDGTTIEAGRYNGLTTDIATGITNALTKDGQNVPTANLPMGSRKFTGLAAGTAAGDSVRYEQANLIGETTVTGHASTADIFAAATARVLFDGTGLTVTAFPSSSLNTWKLVRFNGVNTLTHSSGLSIAGGGNVTTASGDVALILSVGVNAVIADYFGAAGTTVRLNALSAATAANTPISNGDYAQRWNWALTTGANIGMRFSESAASTGASSTLVAVDNASGSTARPFISQWTASTNGLFGWATDAGLLVQAPSITGVAGPDVTVEAGTAGGASLSGGDVTVAAGDSGASGGTPGDVNLAAGDRPASGVGGMIELSPGNNAAGDSGAVVVNGGPLVFEGANTPTVLTGGGTIDGTDSAFTLTFSSNESSTGMISYSRNMGESGTVPVVVGQLYSTSGNFMTVTSTRTTLTWKLWSNNGTAHSVLDGEYMSFIVIPKSRGI